MDAPASGIVVVAGIVVAAGTVVEMSESGVLLLHVVAMAHIETTPRQTATFVDRQRREYERLVVRRYVTSVAPYSTRVPLGGSGVGSAGVDTCGEL